MNLGKHVPAAFLADFYTLGVAIAQIAYYDMIFSRVHVRDSAGASVYAFSACDAGFFVYQNCACFLAY
jgi:hypothetical protein